MICSRLFPVLMAIGSLVPLTRAQTVVMDAFSGSQKIGSATLTRKAAPQGGSVGSMKLTATQAGKTLILVMETTLDKTSTPTKKVMKVDQDGKLTTVIATFNKAGAKVVATGNGKAITKDFPATSKISRADISERWFRTVQPKPGTVSTYLHFNLQNQAWEQVTGKYVGPKVIKINGKNVNSHEVQLVHNAGVSKQFLDSKGMPLVIEEPGIRLVRRM